MQRALRAGVFGDDRDDFAFGLERILAGVFGDDRDDFAFGLERILDGVERLVERRA